MQISDRNDSNFFFLKSEKQLWDKRVCVLDEGSHQGLFKSGRKTTAIVGEPRLLYPRVITEKASDVIMDLQKHLG